MSTKIRLRNFLMLIILVLSFFLLPIVSVWKKAEITDLIKLNQELKETKERILSENLIKKYKYEQLKKRERIEVLAYEADLTYPRIENIILLRKE